jgi:uncharacterized iron-regulated membrane protein
MSRVRSIIFWIHLPLGIAAGALVVLMSVTGVLLTYQKQMQYWADASAFRAAPPAGAQALPVASLIESVRQAEYEMLPTTITWRRDPAEPVAVAMGTRTVYVNPYTGAVHGEGRGQRMRAFFTSVTGWHRWLATSVANRDAGRRFTGAANLAFLFILLTGAYLWFPRTWKWPQLRNALWFRGGLTAKARDFNWHHAIGVWSLAPLIVIVLGGVVISYPWATDLVYRAMGDTPPPRAAAKGSPGKGAPSNAAAVQAPRPPAAPGADDDVPAVPFDALVLTAQARVPDWNMIMMRFPERNGPVAFTIDRGTAGQPQKRALLTIDPAKPEAARWEPFASQTAGRRARSWLRFLHTGEAFGLIGQTIAGLVSAGAVFLAYTGSALSFRRFFTRRRPGV